ncbi:MAG TPA: DNA gyrase subunit A [Candidatus Polarisedimenticolia bacterium]|jgi:DNA gyrase subunit A|nr:DNA gyrase subunit A [Candidatus Polarisedimenticolia bacterium]
MDDTTTQSPDEKIPVNIEDEMRRSYLDYAMSVIIGRALPDVRDGFKPVHRRALYAMHELKNDHDKPYKKSARIVGDVIGKFHPHGEAAVYDTIVRMAQEFSLRYPLVDGQGNFGSVDGDPPAAMRYTEIRMAKLAHEMLADIEKNTVDLGPNYDASLTEPLVLPSRFPNLLVNGSSGIAVGMATNIPPHNLTEVSDAVIATIKNPEITIDELMQMIPGPDFPTAGFICGREGIRQAYKTGRGILQMRARANIEEGRGGKTRIVVTEIPYQVNKARLVEQIATLVTDKRIEGIADIRDESNREGIRVVLDLKRGEIADVILNNLFKYTQMQETFGVIFLAIVHNQPRVLNLRELIDHFIEHRHEVIVRRTRFDLERAEERAHILEGLKIALDHLDEMIALIRAAKTPGEAKEAMRLRFKLSDVQAQAILDLRLQKLTGLERQKVLDEYAETLKLIARLKEILGNDRLVKELIIEELQEIRKTFGDGRRTQIIDRVDEISVEELIAEEEMVVTLTHSGYIKRSPLVVYRSQQRGGKGRIGMTVRDEDFVEHLFIASTHDYFLIFTNKGRVHWLKVHEIPQIGVAAKGKALVNFIGMSEGEKMAALIATKNFPDDRYVVLTTTRGTVKKTALSAFSHPRSGGIIALSIDEGDSLLDAKITDGKADLFLASNHGKAIRFPETEVRPMGRGAYGVRGMLLREGDFLVEMDAIRGVGYVLTVTEKGLGKRTPVSEYRVQGRGGMGIINIRTIPKGGSVIAVSVVTDDDQIMVVTQFGMMIRMAVSGISVHGRDTQGVRIIHLDEGDSVVAVAKVVEKEAE